MVVNFIFVLLLLCLHCIFVTSQSNLRYTRETYFDYEKQFQMIWTYNTSHMTVELTVNTTGWIAIGFSPNGDMVDADIHLGWVDNGKAHITDRHGLDHNGYPPLDNEQNVELLEGWECDGVTFLKFVRQLAACDEKQDRPITTDTTRVIYAYDDNDPDQDGNFNKHTFQHRGTKFLLVLQPSPNLEFKETDALTFEVRANNSAIPIQETYYKCTLIKLPELDAKHHIIKKEPIVEEKYSSIIHHMNAYACTDLEHSTFAGNSEPCFPNPHPDFDSCHLMIFGFAIGTEATAPPEHAGYPLGGPGGFKYIKLSVHYNNPDLKEIRDASGFRIHYTPTLRKYDAATMKVGLLPTPFQLFIPPRTDSYKVDSGCDSGCLANNMKEAYTSFIMIYKIALHAHTLGRKVTLKHIRNGKELPPLVKDDNFNFEFHQGHVFTPERVFRKGDSLQIVCDYSSKNKSHATLGGVDTTQEMCLSYIYYYPKIPMSECYSGPTSILKPLQKMMGIKSTKKINRKTPFLEKTLSDFVVTSPPEMANQTIDDVVTNYQWDKESSDNISKTIHQSKRIQACIKSKSKKVSLRRPIVIKYSLEDNPEIKVCKAPSAGFPTEVPTDICGIY